MITKVVERMGMEPRAPSLATSGATAVDTQDCLGCRITGTLTLGGLATFFMVERAKLPRHDVGQRRWLLFCSGAFAAAGVWRATTGMFATVEPSSAQDEAATKSRKEGKMGGEMEEN